MLKVHDMRSDKQNTSVHAVVRSLVFDRVESGELSDKTPTVNLRNVQLKDLLKLDAEEIKCTRKRYKVFLGKISCDNFEYLHPLSAVVPDHTSCRYQHEMASKSIVAPLPVLMKDEKRYSDIYSKAGICDIPTNQDHTPDLPDNARSRPDQPFAHIPPIPEPNDPLRNIKVPCFGDQLTQVRLAGVKDLRSGSHTPRDRFEQHHSQSNVTRMRETSEKREKNKGKLNTKE